MIRVSALSMKLHYFFFFEALKTNRTDYIVEHFFVLSVDNTLEIFSFACWDTFILFSCFWSKGELLHHYQRNYKLNSLFFVVSFPDLKSLQLNLLEEKRNNAEKNVLSKKQKVSQGEQNVTTAMVIHKRLDINYRVIDNTYIKKGHT